MLQPLYSGKETWYPLERTLGRPQSWYGHKDEEKKIPSLPLSVNELWSSSPKPSHYTELPWLFYDTWKSDKNVKQTRMKLDPSTPTYYVATIHNCYNQIKRKY